MTTTPRHLVVMGVSGAGKTTVAEMLRDRTGWPFAEADDFHPRANIAKMEQGIPLDDDDRRPWLDALGRWIAARDGSGMSSIVTCSALKREYRDRLREAADGVTFIHLDGDRATLEKRMKGRSGHFMPPALLDSQLETLEELEADEPGWVFSIEQPPVDVIDAIFARLHD